MKTFGLIIVIALTLTSCADKHEGEQKTGLLSNLVSITDNEDKGVKEILDYYGGQCKYAIGASASTDTGSKKYFELEMSKSDPFEKYAQIVEMPASNVAYLFYKNLKDEKTKYDEIHTVVVFNDGTKKTFVFDPSQLELVVKAMPSVLKVVDILKSKNYQSLSPILNDSTLMQYDKKGLIANIEKMDPQFGNIKEFIPYGFRFKNLDNGKRVLHISGALMRDKQSNEFSIDLNPDSSTDEIYLLQYQL
jgi:hypothetical protein